MSFRLNPISKMLHPNSYVAALSGALAGWAFDETTVENFKGKWRSEVFRVDQTHPMDLEIGTGNGYFFAHHAEGHPSRNLVGLEIKFKPLNQAIKRAMKTGATNMRIARFNASDVTKIFAPGELNDVYLFFPDPWPKTRHWKHRLVTPEFLDSLWALQKPGSRFYFKTDHEGYFDWTLERILKSKYQIEGQSRDLHNSEWATSNFQTHFEKLWTSKGLKTHFLAAVKPIPHQ